MDTGWYMENQHTRMSAHTWCRSFKVHGLKDHKWIKIVVDKFLAKLIYTHKEGKKFPLRLF